jgi:hypothetical protein
MADFFYNDSELQMDSKFILCIEEHDNRSIDTRLFIGYSELDNDYYVRGKRQDIGGREFVPYAFRCESTNDLYDFIEFVVGPRSKSSIILYNFNNLEGTHDDDLTYEFFEEHIDRDYEVAAYDDVKLKRSQIKKYLRMLKNTYNWEYKN